MKYIDKRPFLSRERDHTVNYLQRCYSGDINNPIPSPGDEKRSFQDFSKPECKTGPSGWLKVLLEEQHYRCCYCMRRLKVNKGENENIGYINIEHVIPRSLSNDIETRNREFDYYYNHSKILSDAIIDAKSFAEKTFVDLDQISREIRMPHLTGLSNLLAACNGKQNFTVKMGCCCNNSRGNSRILPIMLMTQGDDDVKYDVNGILSISVDDGTLTKIVQELNDETLQEIRRIWYHLSFIDIELSKLSSYSLLQRIKLFETAYGTKVSRLPEQLKKYIGVLPRLDFYWSLLLDYDWFYGYYLKHH